MSNKPKNNAKNVLVLLQIRPYKSATYAKSNGIQKFQTRLSQNYVFYVFTNLSKNEADLLFRLLDC